MKMKVSGLLAFALLSISIMSYGMGAVAFATSDPNPALSISSNAEIYTNGAPVTISGTIGKYDPLSLSASAVTYLVKSPDNSIVSIGQVMPKSDGSFTFSFLASGPLWKNSGDYTINVKYGADKSDVSINYAGGEPIISTPTPTEPTTEPTTEVVEEMVDCGPGTESVNGVCQVVQTTTEENGGGCLIATATYGSELAPQVQLLREIRDNQLLNTESGTVFMKTFNEFYYSFSPTIADWERENPAFKEMVKITLTPMISSLSILNYVDMDSEVSVLGYGISLIILNVGMYLGVPAVVIVGIKKRF